MTIHDAPPRPWHVSTAVLDSVSTHDRAVGNGGSAPSGVDRTTPAAATPLLRRIVTGQVIGWRIRLLLARVLRVRRGAARRALAWLDRHP
ncbi:MAG: hypothetical protein E4H05_07895, partial [Acidimicrobiales bacterium]